MDVSTIEWIKIDYENCETFTINGHDILDFHLINPKKKYSLYDFPKKRYIYCDEISLTISKRANKIGALWMEKERKPFERTHSFSDIAYFIVAFKDGKEERFYPFWEGNSYLHNPSQCTILHENGDLTIEIKK